MNNDRQFGIVGLATLLVINIPSVKLFVGVTSVVNAIALVGLVGAALVRLYPNLKTRKNRDGSILLLGVWLLTMLITLPEHVLLRSIESGHVSSTVKTLYTVVCMATIVLSARARDVHTLVMGQIAWGVFVAVCFLLGWVHYSDVENLHYNTVTLPLALSTLSAIAYWVESKSLSTSKKFLLALVIAVNVFGLLNLFGRSPFIFIVVIVLGSYIAKRKNIIKKSIYSIKALAYVSIVISASIFLISRLNIEINFHVFNRMANLVEGGDSRVSIYAEAIRFIAENPFGYGWGAYEQMSTLSPYPHNIILEVGITAGLLGVVLVGSLLLFYLKRVLIYYHTVNRRLAMQSAYMSLYFIFTFMVSYSISSSYMLFVSMCMSTAIPLCKNE